MLWFTPYLSGIGAVLALVFWGVFTKRTAKFSALDWEHAVNLEANRVHRIYRFIALFTDVPEITGRVRRRKYLDWALPLLAPDKRDTFGFLYARSFLRGSEYSGLVVRLSIIGILILVFVHQAWIAVAVALLLLYLIGFQLLPLYGQFDYMLLARIYPVDNATKARALEHLVTRLLGAIGVLFALVLLITLPNVTALKWGGIAAIFVEVILFARLYLPYRVKSLAK
jgi:ABC-2 type transport system permease protein